MGLFDLKPVPSSTQNELKQRATTAYKQFNTSRMPWAYVMSLASTGPKPLTIFRTFNSAYDVNATLRPKTLLQEIAVSSFGELGTLRKCVINMIVFTDSELDEIAKSYFIPNMSVRVLFGWSLDANGRKAPNPFTEPLPDDEASNRIKDLVNEYPNMDGIQGRVSTWNFSLTEDGAWDVKLELIGAGASVNNVGIIKSVQECNCETVQAPPAGGAGTEGGDEKSVENNAAFEACLVELIDDSANIQNIKSAYSSRCAAYIGKYNAYERDETGREETKWLFGMFGDGLTEVEEVFIDFETLLILLTNCSDQNNKQPDVEYSCNNNSAIESTLSYFENLTCADPRIAIIPGTRLNPSQANSCLVQQGGATKIRLSGVLFNVIYLRKVFNSIKSNQSSDANAQTIQAFLKQVLNDFNFYCGNPWEFEFADSTAEAKRYGEDIKASTRLTPVDVSDRARDTPFTIKANPRESMVRKVDLSYKPTDAMKTQALYSGKSVTKSVASNKSCSNRFLLWSEDLAKNRAQPNKNTGDQKEKNHCETSSVCNKGNGDEVPQPIERVKQHVKDDNVSSLRQELIQLKNEAQNSSSRQICRSPIMPFEFAATLTGVGGFVFGQSITCDRLPQDLRDNFVYQVTGVEHTVSPTDWTTGIKTVARYQEA